VTERGRTGGRLPVPRSVLRRLAAVLLSVCLGGTVGAAEPPIDGATAAVRSTLDKATRIGSDDGTRDHQLASLRSVARELVDTRTMGRRAIGERFAGYTTAQQDEFLALFDELIVRSYLQKLLLFRDPKFRFGKEEQRGAGVFVETEVVTEKDSYQVGYEMQHEGDRWLATDIIVEGVSLTSNYSNQFASLLRDRSFDDLLDLMRRKVDHFSAKDAPR